MGAIRRRPLDGSLRRAIVLSMDPNVLPTRSRWFALLAAVVAFVAALGGRDQIGAWPFGILLLIAWALLAYGITVLRIGTALRLMLVVSTLALAVFVWDYLAPQPRIQLGGVRVQKLPSTISPGVIELVIHNIGPLPADVVGSAAGDLVTQARTAAALVAGGAKAELSKGLEGADTFPSTGTMVIPPGQTTRVQVDVPASQRAWYFSSGQATVLVTARLRYRDRIFHREKQFCMFTTPPSSNWQSCPFLND